MTHVSYVGREQNKGCYCFSGIKGVLYVNYLWPHVSKKTDKGERILEAFSRDEKINNCKYGYFDKNEDVVWILLNKDQEKYFREFLENYRLVSEFCSAGSNSLLSWGFTPIKDLVDYIRKDLDWNPLLYREVEFGDKELERKLRNGERVDRDSLDDIIVKEFIELKTVKNGVWGFLDIEATKYNEGDDSIDGIGFSVYKNKKCIRRVILNRWNIRGEVDSWDTESYNNEEELIRELRNLINKYDFNYICTYGDYDIGHILKRLKEDPNLNDEDFNIGRTGGRPLIKVKQPSKTRFLIKGREHINLLDLMKVFCAYAPSKRLDVCAGFFSKVLGYEWKGKDLSYEELKDASPEELFKYLSMDVKVLEDILFSKRSKFIDIIFNCAKAFGVSLTEVCYSANAAEKKRDEGYFKTSGTFKDPGYLAKKKLEARQEFSGDERKFKEKILNLSEYRLGVFNGVNIVYIPLGIFVKGCLQKRFHSIDLLIKDYERLKGSEFRLSVAKYIDAASRKLFIDYYFYMKYREEYKRLMGNYNLEEVWLAEKLFEGSLKLFYSDYRLKKDNVWKVDIIEKRLSVNGREFFDKLIEINGLDDVISLVDSEFKFIREYKGFAGTHGFKVEDFEGYLNGNVENLKRYLEELKIINFNGDLIFVQGDIKDLEESGLGVVVKKDLNLVSYGIWKVAYLFEDCVVGCGINTFKFNNEINSYKNVIYKFMRTFLSGNVEGAFSFLNILMKDNGEEVRKELFNVEIGEEDLFGRRFNGDLSKGKLSRILVNIVNDSRVEEELFNLAVGEGNLDYFCEMFGFRL